MKVQLAKFLAYMSSLPIAAHIIMFAAVGLSVALTYFLLKDKSLKQNIYTAIFVLYLPFLFFYIAKPHLLTFLESKMKNSFDDVSYSESAGKKIIQ